jgi:hypothetical protein
VPPWRPSSRKPGQQSSRPPWSTWTNGDQAKTGTSGQQMKCLGRIIVVHPGHPLVGQPLPVVRRYREQGQRLWVIELPDGSRQYLPASWCTPLAPVESPTMSGDRSVGEAPPGRPPSPLSLVGLRDLATLVRHLREREASRGGEHDAGATAPGTDYAWPKPSAPEADAASPRQRGAAQVGELPSAGSPTADHAARPNCASTGPRSADRTVRRGQGVRRP